MKSKLLTLFTVCSIILIASCKKESNTSASIIGRWSGQRLHYVTTLTQSGITDTQDTTMNCINGEYMNFASNGTYTQGDNDTSSTETGTYTYVNNTITMISTVPDTTIFNVDLLDAHTLNLTSSYNENGPDYTFNALWTVYLTR